MTPFGPLLVAGLALAQPPITYRPLDTNAVVGSSALDALAKADASAKAELAEDVEVLRRILNRAVGLANEPAMLLGLAPTTNQTVPSYSNPGAIYPNLTTNYYGTALTTAVLKPADPFDGVYLKGHGVVYTLKIKAGEHYQVEQLRRHAGLAVGCNACHAAGTIPAGKLEPQAKSQAELTEWDRTRNALRGVKDPAPAAPSQSVDPKDVCKPGLFTEALTAALAQNGRHLRHVAPPESVTLVVTLDGVYGPAQSAVTFTNANQLLTESFLKTHPASVTRPLDPAAPAEGLAGFSADEARQIALGDLHMKQARMREAAESYRKALVRIGDGAVKLAGSANRPDAEAIKKNVADVRKKLAQALLAAGDLDAAKKVLDAAIATKVEFEPAGEKPAAALPVPAKLVLTVKKADLDRADKLSAAEFRKLVTVETVGLPPADKAKK